MARANRQTPAFKQKQVKQVNFILVIEDETLIKLGPCPT